MCERLIYEKKAYAASYHTIVGLDEAGRGPLAGPLVVAGVIFPQGYYDERINDSKKLSEKKREMLYDLIISEATAYNIQIIDVDEVDRLNVYQASRMGMFRVIDEISPKPDFALSDAMPLGDKIPHEAIIKGDAKSLSIGAASILAKVTRDRIMRSYAQTYPDYGFEKHKGYPTKQHLEALKTYGVLPIHRKSFGPVKALMFEQLSLDI